MCLTLVLNVLNIVSVCFRYVNTLLKLVPQVLQLQEQLRDAVQNGDMETSHGICRIAVSLGENHSRYKHGYILIHIFNSAEHWIHWILCEMFMYERLEGCCCSNYWEIFTLKASGLCDVLLLSEQMILGSGLYRRQCPSSRLRLGFGQAYVTPTGSFCWNLIPFDGAVTLSK